jgi:hypothetical protein
VGETVCDDVCVDVGDNVDVDEVLSDGVFDGDNVNEDVAVNVRVSVGELVGVDV